jgi:hypothetical protein
MKIKVYVLDLEIPRRIKRLAVLLGLPVALLLTIVAVAYASITTFKAGDPLSAATMNANFADLNMRLTALEGALTRAPTVASPHSQGVIVWKDSTGTIVPVVRPLGDEFFSGGPAPDGYFEVFDAASQAVWVFEFGFGVTGPVQVAPTSGVYEMYSGTACTGTEYVYSPPPPRYSFDDSVHPGVYYVVRDSVQAQRQSVRSKMLGTTCTSFSKTDTVDLVAFSSLVTVTMPTTPPGVPPYHPEPL